MEANEFGGLTFFEVALDGITHLPTEFFERFRLGED